MIIWAFNCANWTMDTYVKINDGWINMWTYYCLLNANKWGYGLIYQDKKIYIDMKEGKYIFTKPFIMVLLTWVVLQPHFERSVRSPLTLPKMGLGSPPGLPKIQNVISGVKTPHIEVYFIPLESSWSVDVQNGLIWTIWTSTAQVMVERRVDSQIGSLTPDH